ncbi:sterile alpha and TIR motif-containing protein 1 isoform X2 [Lingula anatina]|uniref:ADP-ribosyl cyclase/cyclic ADP-ribose hydrolase n=1 Tax=Lingula anatina TaxID=7574 RepID=A0A1S3JLN9_LINAN|nr:sterile alpha and TIR motif-containing protein 1 isoform X2 [Lingula anatina]|eukprot:XP_013411298.1 sterile alpha and TIR motif-containing protein 1 isoform X2 [Lingula anatina]
MASKACRSLDLEYKNFKHDLQKALDSDWDSADDLDIYDWLDLADENRDEHGDSEVFLNDDDNSRFHVGYCNMAQNKGNKTAEQNSFPRIASETKLTEKDSGLSTRQAKKNFERTQSTSELAKESKGKERIVKSSSFEKEGSVSEHSQVYWDLSKAVEMEDSKPGRLKISLQTIHQKEELSNDKAQAQPQQRRYSVEYKRTATGSSTISTSSSSSSSTQRQVMSPPVYTIETISSGPALPKTPPQPLPPQPISAIQEFLPKTKRTLQTDLAACKTIMKQDIKKLQDENPAVQCGALREILGIIVEAWGTAHYGRDLAYGLCDFLRVEGGLDIIIKNCSSANYEVQLESAKVLEQTLTTTNRDYLVNHGLEVVLTMSRKNKDDANLSRASTGIIENLFKHSEGTCGKVIHLGGLNVILYSCRAADQVTLRHCAVALANLAIYGGAENQEEMIKNNAPEWLFPLAFNEDDSIRYYACLAIGVLSANKEIEADVLNSGTLELVSPFLTTHSPAEFAYSDRSHIQGRDKEWLKRLIPVLNSKRKEAQALAAFHFAMEANIKSEQNKKGIFKEIAAIEPLKKVAGSPNKLASKLAAEALRIVGEEVPHSLTQQVPLWSVEDVRHWVTEIGFGEYAKTFVQFHVDGDLLLLLSEQNLRDDLGMQNGITRKRFMRELVYLKRTSDYSCCDPTKLNEWILKLNPELTKYTYQIIRSGVDKNLLPAITEEQLRTDCNIENGIDRMKILQAVKGSYRRFSHSGSAVMSPGTPGKGVRSGNFMSPVASCYTDGLEKNPLAERPIDVFISYRRSNGSQLASLLKVHLQLRGLTVFLDIERLRAGKFDMNLLTSVKNAKNFVLVLTPGSLDRCLGDDDQRDWVHKEIVAALESACNIIPVMDNFHWPASETMPEDMRAVSFFNGIRWIHDYQDACVDKLERFIRGEGAEDRYQGCLSKGNSIEMLSPASELHGYGPALCRNNGGDSGIEGASPATEVPPKPHDHHS